MPKTSTSSRLSTIFTITIFCSMFVLSLFFLHIRNEINSLKLKISDSSLPPDPVETHTQNWPLYQNQAQNFSLQILPSLAQSSPQPKIITTTSVDFWLSWKNDLLALDLIIDSRHQKDQNDLLSKCFGNQSLQSVLQNRPLVACSSKFINGTKTGASLNYYILDGNRLIRLWATSQDLDQISLLDLDQVLTSFRFLK